MLRDSLMSIETPAGTDTWCPIAHWLVVDKLVAKLDKLGYMVTQENYSTVGKDSEDMFGTLRIAPKQKTTALTLAESIIAPPSRSDYSMMIGVKNSNRKKFPVTFGFGANVFVCSNGMFVAETVVDRRHTKFLMEAIDGKIELALQNLLVLESSTDKRIEHYKNVELSRSERNDLVVTAYEQGIVPGRSMGNLVDEVNKPRHSEFRNDNLWGVYNCVTEILKVSPNQLQDRSMEMTRLADAMYGFDPNKVIESTNVLAV